VSQTADKNLLFGILALQVNFVSRDQLIAGMNAWVLEKSTLIGEIFVRQQWMTHDRCRLLEALVNEHVAKNDGDVEKTLQQLSSVDPYATQNLAQIKDSAVQKSLQCVFVLKDREASEHSVDPFATLANASTERSGGFRFQILRPHRSGGLGEVFVAQDKELGREVALKEIQESHANNSDSRLRFIREAEITGRLEHPGIVPVYALGTYDNGRPYYAMRFIRGDSLQDALEKFHANPASKSVTSYRNGPLAIAFRDLLGRFIDVCEAIHYAHSRGVLHRDLKPSNIMLGEYGETLVVDWGLAKLASSAPEERHPAELSLIQPSFGSGSTPTMLGSAVGTPAYMSPEQAAGDIDRLGPATDIYSLGATLFKLLTGVPSVSGKNVNELVEKTRRGETENVRDYWRSAPPALIAICNKAIATKPLDRYSTAKDLADDIKRWLAEEPVSAYPESLLERTKRFIRNHQTLMASASVFGLAILGFVQVSSWYQLRLGHAKREAAIEKEFSEREVDFFKKQAAEQEQFAMVNAARELSAKRTPGWSWINESQLTDAVSKYMNEDCARLMREEIARILMLPDFRKRNAIQENFVVSSCVYSHGGSLLALGQRTSTGLNVQIRMLDAESYATIKTLTFFPSAKNVIGKFETDGVTSMRYTSDNRFLYVGTRAGEIHQFDLQSYKSIARWQAHGSRVDDMCLSDDDKYLITGSRDNTIKWWDTKGQTLIKTESCPGNRSIIKYKSDFLAFSNGQQRFAIDPNSIEKSPKEKIKLTTRVASVIPGIGTINATAEEIVLCNELGDTVRKMHPNTPLEGINSIHIGCNNRYMILENGTSCDVWEIASGQRIGSVNAEAVTSCTFDPHRPRFLIADNGSLDCYEIRDEPIWQLLPIQENRIEQLTSSGDSAHLFTSCSTDESQPSFQVSKWQTNPIRLIGKIKLQLAEATKFASNQKGTCISFLKSPQRQLVEIDLDTQSESVLYPSQIQASEINYSKNDQQLWFSCHAIDSDSMFSKLNAWRLLAIDLPTNKPFFEWNNQLQQLTKMYSRFTDLCVGNRSVLAATRESALIWNLTDANPNGQDCRQIPIPTGIIEKIAFLDNEKLAVIGMRNGQLSIIDLSTDKILTTNDAQSGAISSIQTIGAKMIIVGDSIGEIAIWHWTEPELKLIARLGPFSNLVESISSFDSNQRMAIHVHNETSVRLLDLRGLIDRWTEFGLLQDVDK